MACRYKKRCTEKCSVVLTRFQCDLSWEVSKLRVERAAKQYRTETCGIRVKFHWYIHYTDTSWWIANYFKVFVLKLPVPFEIDHSRRCSG